MTKRFLPLIAIFSIMAFCSCRQTSDPKSLVVIPSSTLIATASPKLIITESTATSSLAIEIPIPTLRFDWHSSYGAESDTAQPTPTAPPSRFLIDALPNSLWIEEYTTGVPNEIFSRHQNAGGLYWGPHGGLIDGKLFQAFERFKAGQAEIHATLDEKEIAIIQCGEPTPVASVITAWTYKSHWIIQSYCHQEFGIYWDGVSLNQSKGYQSSFAFQLLGQKPFYLFKKNDQIWLYYDEEEFALGYNKVTLNYCCEYAAPTHYENMIKFGASINNQLYLVMIGIH